MSNSNTGKQSADLSLDKSVNGVSERLGIDEYGYQMLDIKSDLISLTFPDGKNFRGPWDMFTNAMDEVFNPDK